MRSPSTTSPGKEYPGGANKRSTHSSSSSRPRRCSIAANMSAKPCSIQRQRTVLRNVAKSRSVSVVSGAQWSEWELAAESFRGGNGSAAETSDLRQQVAPAAVRTQLHPLGYLFWRDAVWSTTASIEQNSWCQQEKLPACRLHLPLRPLRDTAVAAQAVRPPMPPNIGCRRDALRVQGAQTPRQAGRKAIELRRLSISR